MTIRILIVEDEAIIADTLATRLTKMGDEVVDLVDTGEDAIATTVSNQPNLVLMDIMLAGDMDGIEAADQIYKAVQIPVVFLTAYADEATLDRAKITKPFGYIVKPFRERELKATIEIAISRHQAEAELQKATAIAESYRQSAEAQNKSQNQYVSMVCHEFRTPLSAIQLSAEMLSVYKDIFSEEKKETHLKRIQAATNNINLLLEEVLLFGKAESGKLELNLQLMSLTEFCKDLIEVIQNHPKTHHQLVFEQQGNCDRVYIDEKLMWHLINNLLANAIKYSPKGGTVILRLACDADNIILQVQDEGIGIAEEDHKSLFEPFQRARNVGKIPGTGLGLAIVKQAVDLHNGCIQVSSKINQGTTFTVTLPKILGY
ncbi:MAG: ATP-binding protein [Spirulinaceae cyanobacterium]